MGMDGQWEYRICCSTRKNESRVCAGGRKEKTYVTTPCLGISVVELRASYEMSFEANVMQYIHAILFYNGLREGFILVLSVHLGCAWTSIV